MVRHFQVAGLTFSLSLPDGHPVLDLLHNYDPFELPGSQLPETVATLGSVRGRGPLPKEVGGVRRSRTSAEAIVCRGKDYFL